MHVSKGQGKKGGGLPSFSEHECPETNFGEREMKVHAKNIKFKAQKRKEKKCPGKDSSVTQF